MLPENVPHCPFCESSSFRPGNAHIGGSLNQQGFTCEECDTFAQLYGHQGGTLLAYISRDICTPIDPDDEYPSWKFPEELTSWVDKTMLPAWRHRQSEMEKHRTVEWNKWLKEVFYHLFPDHTDYKPYGKKSYYDLPDDARDLIESTFGGQKRPQQTGVYLPLPPELDGPVYPPQCPDLEGLSLWFYVEGCWDVVDPKMSAMFTAPEDPILARNREFFTDVWKGLAVGLERDMPPVAETKNRYGGIEPWYAFQLGNAVIVTGWRKRVIRIGVELETGFLVNDIRALARDRDKVTYEAFGPLITRTEDQFKALLDYDGKMAEESKASILEIWKESFPAGELTRDGGWKDDRPIAMKLEVHAWGKAKTIEYLTTICRAVLLAQEA